MKIKTLILILLSSLLLFSCGVQDIKRDTIVPKNIESPFFWDINSKTQVIIFSDFECPACINFEKFIGKKVLSDYALNNKIWLTYKNFPLSFHKNAFEDAVAVMCGHTQWKYKEFSESMYTLEDEKKWANISSQERQNIAQKIWLNMDEYNKCISEWNYINKINEDMALWEKMQLAGTPSIYINGTLMQYQSEQDFFSILDQLIQK